MNTEEVTIVRIYLSEASGQLEPLIKRLHDWEKVRGMTVFRGITGYGDSGKILHARFAELALDLPIVVEFFDEPAKVKTILEHIHSNVKPHHVLWWSATTNETDATQP
jgi:PII-like signaling protein